MKNRIIKVIDDFDKEILINMDFFGATGKEETKPSIYSIWLNVFGIVLDLNFSTRNRRDEVFDNLKNNLFSYHKGF